MRIAALILAACGAPEVKGPNTKALCEKAVQCEVFEPAQLAPCVACLEHWGEQVNEDVKSNLPPPHTIDCELLAYVANTKRISECVEENWWSILPPGDVGNDDV